MIKHASLATLLVLLAAAPVRADLPSGFNWDDDAVQALAAKNPAAMDSASPAERARIVGILMGGSSQDHADALNVLSRASDVDRFQTFRTLDRQDSTDMRAIYDQLDAGGQAQLLQLAKSAGTAATAAGLQQTGIISDNDDTAFPTDYTPDGTTSYKGSSDFYKTVGLGTDGQGDPANIHYVSARIPALFPDSRARLAAAGLPDGTFDGDRDVKRFLTGGLDGIQASKIENIQLWLELHPGQRFVMLGDSLQRDPEVYDWALKNHPDQVELVLIHKAGGPVRNPADYKGEVFFDDYPQASQIVAGLGIPQPGAKLPDQPVDFDKLPLPDTDVSKITAAEAKVGIVTKVEDQIKENVPPLAEAAGKEIASPFVRAWDAIKNGVSSIFGSKDKKAAADDKTASNDPQASQDGVTAAMKARGATDGPQGNRTGMDRVLDNELDKTKPGDAAEGR